MHQHAHKTPTIFMAKVLEDWTNIFFVILFKMSIDNPSQKSVVLEYSVKPSLGCYHQSKFC